jgi:diketogulonate reductase-like aldo/keto reductase
MEQRTFAWTGCDIPVIGQGTWEIKSPDALRVGLDLAMTHVDTAEMYGTEEIVAEAIAGRRGEVFLASKVLPSNASYKGTLRACEQSLQRLQTDYLDLYMLHWAGSHPIGETMRAMEKLVASHMIRFIGVSNLDVEALQAAESALRHERLAANQVLYHLGDRGIERRLLPYCRDRQIAIVAYSPFGHKSFPSPRSPGGRVLAEIAERRGKTVRQVVLRWVTRDPNVFTIPKASNAAHVRENAGGAGWQLDEQDLAEIDRAFPAPDRDVPLGMI